MVGWGRRVCCWRCGGLIGEWAVSRYDHEAGTGVAVVAA